MTKGKSWESAELSAAHGELLAQPGERVHAQWESIQPYPDQLVVLSQVRKGRNGEFDNIKESIYRQKGLLNPIDVAPLSRSQLEEYIAFTNAVWQDDRSIDDFARKEINDTYYLVCAGHTRYAALASLEAEGRLPRVRMPAKLHQINTVQEILDLQLDENLHTKPPVERAAFAIVESYLWGETQGHWASPGEYIDRRGDGAKESRVLNDALDYLALDANSRRFVLEGHVPYTVGVEAGRTAKKLRQYYMFKYGYSEHDMHDKAADSPSTRISQLILERMTIELSSVAEKRLNSTAGKKKFESFRGLLDKEMSSIRDQRDKNRAAKKGMLIEDFILGDSAEEEYRRDLAYNREQLGRLVQRYGRMPSQYALDLLQLSRPVAHDLVEDALREYPEAARRAAGMLERSVGDAALGGTLFSIEDTPLERAS